MVSRNKIDRIVHWLTFVQKTVRTRNEATERNGLFEMINSFRWHHVVTSHIDLQSLDQLFPKVYLTFWTVYSRPLHVTHLLIQVQFTATVDVFCCEWRLSPKCRTDILRQYTRIQPRDLTRAFWLDKSLCCHATLVPPPILRCGGTWCHHHSMNWDYT